MAAPEDAKPWRPFRYSLRSLMLLLLLAAAYLGGRFAARPAHVPVDALEGKWQASLPAGFLQPVDLQHLESDRFLLTSRASVFNGVYRWKDGRLMVISADDARMAGLEWKWDGEELTLVAEPQGTPTGQSYLGTTIVRAPSPKAK